jgi:molecular chaperone GrpE
VPSTPYHRILKYEIARLREVNRDLNMELDNLNKQLQELNDRLKFLTEQNLRFAADVENFQRATEQKIMEMQELASLRIIRELLPILDSLDNATDQSARALRSQMLGVLEKEGLKVIDNVNVPFDPNIHESVGFVEGAESGKVAKIIRNGYKIKDKLLRPALVLVGKEVN